MPIPDVSVKSIVKGKYPFVVSDVKPAKGSHTTSTPPWINDPSVTSSLPKNSSITTGTNWVLNVSGMINSRANKIPSSVIGVAPADAVISKVSVLFTTVIHSASPNMYPSETISLKINLS